MSVTNFSTDKVFTDKIGDDDIAGDIALVFVDSRNYAEAVAQYGGEGAINFAALKGFRGRKGEVLLLPPIIPTERTALIGYDDSEGDLSFGAQLAQRLVKDHSYYFADAESLTPESAYDIALGWGLQQYREESYKSEKNEKYRVLSLPRQIDRDALCAEVEAVCLTRRLINTPANDMNPETLQAEAETLAEQYNAEFKSLVGETLLQQNFPLIHAVGRASNYAPRLLEINYAPKKADFTLTLIGKGVCFDSGGLDIKPASAMLLMKKDMGGAAHALGLARLIMQRRMSIRLRVLIPAVENAISGNAFRPMDIITSRNGKTVEVGDTDAEGRLILADALDYACQTEPHSDLIIDFATLTGAARVAVGTEIAAMFANRQKTADALLKAAESRQDPIWQLPLHAPYRKLLDSHMADISSTGTGGYAGAITAALFLQEFVAKNINWVHFDIMAWNVKSRPGHPIGGEAMAIRAIYHYLTERSKNA